jgi:hypothetical protein
MTELPPTVSPARALRRGEGLPRLLIGLGGLVLGLCLPAVVREAEAGAQAEQAELRATKLAAVSAEVVSVSAEKDLKVVAGKHVVVNAGDELVLQTGDASITMRKDGSILIKGKDITFDAAGKISAKASSDTVIKGVQVKDN